jgi:hypothetical protein
MDPVLQQIIIYAVQAIVVGFCTVIWFSYRDMKAKLEEQQKDVAAYKLHVAEHYVTQNVLSKALEGLTASLEKFDTSMGNRLDRIENKLDSKQDKT